MWGGGVYQSEEFYREADKRGVLIWQEFMFACSLYPADPGSDSIFSSFFFSILLNKEQLSVMSQGKWYQGTVANTLIFAIRKQQLIDCYSGFSQTCGRRWWNRQRGLTTIPQSSCSVGTTRINKAFKRTGMISTFHLSHMTWKLKFALSACVLWITILDLVL